MPFDEFEKYGPSYQESTCDQTIKLPVIKKYIEESSFSGAFIDDIANLPGFTVAWNCILVVFVLTRINFQIILKGICTRNIERNFCEDL